MIYLYSEGSVIVDGTIQLERSGNVVATIEEGMKTDVLMTLNNMVNNGSRDGFTFDSSFIQVADTAPLQDMNTQTPMGKRYHIYII